MFECVSDFCMCRKKISDKNNSTIANDINNNTGTINIDTTCSNNITPLNKSTTTKSIELISAILKNTTKHYLIYWL